MGFEVKMDDENIRGHPGLNQGPLDLQSNALPLSYIPMVEIHRCPTHLVLVEYHIRTSVWVKYDTYT